MKVLVTGSKGFLGSNLVATLKTQEYDVMEFDRETTLEELEVMCQNCDIVFHLAGVNRSINPEDYAKGNTDLSENLVFLLQKHHNRAAVVFSSSIQSKLDNDYGNSKREAETVFANHAKSNHSKVYIYQLTNLFGKWNKPNYNSVISTWSHKISRNEAIEVSDPMITLNLNYVDDVVQEFMAVIEGNVFQEDSLYYQINPTYTKTLQTISDLLHKFKDSRSNLFIPNMEDPFERKLYATYLSYIPTNEFSYDLKMNNDERGSFTEFLKTEERGQVSINIAKPGITKGEHWHHTKNEKFLVVSGSGTIKLRHINSREVITYNVSGEKLKVVDIPPGYTHNITNTGHTDMVTVMWVNEPFDPNTPDTFYKKVE